MGRIGAFETANASFGEYERRKRLKDKWNGLGIGKGKERINASLDKRSISYHKILKKRKTIDQSSLLALAFLTILIKKKCLADRLINQPILLNQNKW